MLPVIIGILEANYRADVLAGVYTAKKDRVDPEIRIMLEAKEESGSRIQENYQQKNSCLCFEICFFVLVVIVSRGRSV